MKPAMKGLTMIACLLAIVALPAGVVGAQEMRSNDGLIEGWKKEKDEKKEKKEKKEKGVPEPSMILLAGAAAAAYARFRRRLRSTEGSLP